VPFTPYHFGPSGFVGLALRRWVDLPVFVLANVIVDIEVLIFHSWPIHRYAHTLLLGTAVGAVWGMAAYPLRNIFRLIMEVFRLPYKPGFWKMVFSGVLGVWLHVVIDAVYHYDVQVFWPSKRNPMYGLLERQTVLLLCIISFLPAIALYVIAILSQRRKK
jgi:membrane-bound metal-dependent hydrolase YbcI (DUF457 family)